MKIIENKHNLQRRVDYALANLKKNRPDLSARFNLEWVFMGMSNRLRRAVGVCKYWKLKHITRVEFSESLFSKISDWDKTDSVVHEMAHALCFQLGLDYGHGKTFKSVCEAMGGSGDTTLKLAAGVAKSNLVKRWVLVKKNNPSCLYYRTEKGANLFMCAVEDAVLLGVIQVDAGAKKVKWLKTRVDSLRSMNPFPDDEWKLVA